MSKSVIVSVNFFNERVNNMNYFKIKAIVLDSSPLDLIIGRSTIKKYGLVRQIPSQFEIIGRVLIIEGEYYNSSDPDLRFCSTGRVRSTTSE